MYGSVAFLGAYLAMDFQLFHGCHGCKKGQQESRQLKEKRSMTTINGNPMRDWREVGDGGEGMRFKSVPAVWSEFTGTLPTARDERGEDRG